MKNKELNIINFCKGNNAEIESLYNQIKQELFLVAYNYLRNKEDAHDAVADCFEKILKTNTTYRQQKFITESISIKALMLVMIRNHCLDMLKQKENRKKIMDKIIPLFNYSNKNKQVDNINNDDFKIMSNCLPDKEKRILLMHIDGYTVKEIALNENKSEKTISNILSEARKSVKDLWEKFM